MKGRINSKVILSLFFITFFLPILPHYEFHALSAENAISYNQKGWEFLNNGNTLKAIVNFKQALYKNSRYKEAMLGLGKAYLKTEAYEEALKLFDEAQRIDRNSQDALNGMGFTMIGMGRYNEALKFFEKTLEIANDNLDAHYGIATIYVGMDKMIWAKRKINNIFRINPYHTESLLLLAEIKSNENRFDESKALIEKAINANTDNIDGYVKYGQILLSEYLKTRNSDYLSDSINEFNNALAKDSNNFAANLYVGYISLLEKNNARAIDCFLKSHEIYPDNLIPMYNAAVAYERNNDIDNAFKFFRKANKKFPYDSILKSRFEDFLVINEIKAGNPSRVKSGNDYLMLARARMKQNLPDQAILFLRRAIMMNPLARETRELLRDYYFANSYYQFYINEIKDLMQIYPEDQYQDMLNTAVIKRRKKLYFKAGYSDEPPVRDVPRVLVLDFNSNGKLTSHFDAGSVIANYITFALQQYGRMNTVDLKKRMEISRGLEYSRDYIENAIDKLQDLTRNKSVDTVDYLVYGDYLESPHFISSNYHLLDYKTGVVIGDFEVSESGHENLPSLSLRVARKIYDYIPYRGRILKVEENKVLINLGSYDGINKGDIVVSYKYNNTTDRNLSVKRKLVFQVDKIDTLVATAAPLNINDMQAIEMDDIIYPLQKRRAKMIK